MKFSSWLCGILLTLTILGRSIAGNDGFDDNPMGHVNLSPIQQWDNAYRCLQNKNMTESCLAKHKLTYFGWVNVTALDTSSYCGNCGNRTQWVLQCIHWMKSDFKFVDGSRVADVNYTINEGCSRGFRGVLLHDTSNAIKLLENKMTLVMSIVTAALLLLINDIL